jgi:hypothetical protein
MTKKLTLGRERLRRLDGAALGSVRGGYSTDGACGGGHPPPPTADCCTLSQDCGSQGCGGTSGTGPTADCGGQTIQLN